jgi:hypothetical protein
VQFGESSTFRTNIPLTSSGADTEKGDDMFLWDVGSSHNYTVPFNTKAVCNAIQCNAKLYVIFFFFFSCRSQLTLRPFVLWTQNRIIIAVSFYSMTFFFSSYFIISFSFMPPLFPLCRSLIIPPLLFYCASPLFHLSFSLFYLLIPSVLISSSYFYIIPF